MSDILQQIRDLQFTDKSAAESLLLSFIRENFPLDVVSIQLTPLAVSLNSFNGFLQLADGTRRFFKSHTETDTVITEYYNAGMLADAGYPVIQPVFNSTEPGKQLLLYEVIDDESVFDVAWKIEAGEYQADQLAGLQSAQNESDDALFSLYQNTLEMQSADTASDAPIHQLFYHRLTGGRLDRFYGRENDIQLPHGRYTMNAARDVKWVINGQQYDDTLQRIIDRAIRLLNPGQSQQSIIGHGDAHNGNVFFRKRANPPTLLYFDPAFAGRHHPLLDLTKPLFHNVFAMWMYFPQEKAATTSVDVEYDDTTWHVQYDYNLADVRMMFLESKVQRVLLPTLRLLKEQNKLESNWRSYLKAALFCCPLLTMDLTDSERFPPVISLLGLAMSVEMGAESHQRRSLIDRVLDDVEEQL